MLSLAYTHTQAYTVTQAAHRRTPERAHRDERQNNAAQRMAADLCVCMCVPLQNKCHPQTIAVCETRAEGLGLEAVVCDESKFEYGKDVCGVLIQYPATDGSIEDYKALVDKAHKANVKVRVPALHCALTAHWSSS